MLQEIIIAGFGGQGVMSIGQLLAYAGMLEEKQVAWIPSYGPEMRGGTANCMVTVSSKKISSPIVTEPNTVIAMNIPSLIKFEPTLVKDGLLLINSSLINQKPTRDDIHVYEIPANNIANKLGNLKMANMVMLGAYLGLTGVVSFDAIIASLRKAFPNWSDKIINLNKCALEAGAEIVIPKQSYKKLG
ncbi:MAG: 2-oxoacid:acceptor oxidoreductase family protein [Bacillota bacterium]|nr:2-oxoacid:acceptor oxidoreductase family protein [Bacillota bacterium]